MQVGVNSSLQIYPSSPINNTVSNSYYKTSNNYMNCEVLYGHFPGRTTGNHEKLVRMDIWRCTFQIIWMHYSLNQPAQSYWRCLFWLQWSWFNSHQQTYLSSKTSRKALKPTQPPIQWALEALSLGLKSPGHEADHSLKCISKIKNEWRYTSNPPTDLHGMHTGFNFYLYRIQWSCATSVVTI